ncbi:MAG: nucleotidyltransferase domain-containing protein [Chloroflexi bacterium]|nr:nucleotidyltransferase domain-containing protein [Chloroflexota bacterium]
MARIPSHINRDIFRTTKEYIAALRDSGLQIQAAYLYGSQAKGTAHEWSDIDIAIIAPNLSGDWHDDLVRLNLLANRIDSRIEAVGYLPKNFRDESPLVWEIKMTGIPLLNTRKRANGKQRRHTSQTGAARTSTIQR